MRLAQPGWGPQSCPGSFTIFAISGGILTERQNPDVIVPVVQGLCGFRGITKTNFALKKVHPIFVIPYILGPLF